VSTYLIDIENNCHVPASNFDICPGNIDKSLQVKFSNVVRHRSVQDLLKWARIFRRDAVCDWNPTANMVTESLLLGVSGVDEKDAEGATTILMELNTVHDMDVAGG